MFHISLDDLKSQIHEYFAYCFLSRALSDITFTLHNIHPQDRFQCVTLHQSIQRNMKYDIIYQLYIECSKNKDVNHSTYIFCLLVTDCIRYLSNHIRMLHTKHVQQYDCKIFCVTILATSLKTRVKKDQTFYIQC